MPILFFSPVLVSSTPSSNTKFIKGSNPLKIPDTFRPPLSRTIKFICTDLYYCYNIKKVKLYLTDVSQYTSIKFKVEHVLGIYRVLNIALALCLCSHFQLETLKAKFSHADCSKTIQHRAMKFISLEFSWFLDRFM